MNGQEDAFWSAGEVKAQSEQSTGQLTIGDALGTCCDSPSVLDVLKDGSFRFECDSCGQLLTLRQVHAARFGDSCGRACLCWEMS